jgi:[acyl-carrier-protein] S-malonyltransferase
MTLGYLDGRAVPRAELDRRIAAARSGPRAGTLPAPGSAEDRQFVRWLAQVVLTEALCEAEAAARGLNPTVPADPGAPHARLDRRAAVELGSITAAAFEGNPAVRAVYEAVTAGVTVPTDTVAAYRAATARSHAPGPVWRLTGADGTFEATVDSLPAALADPLRAASTAVTVSVGGWTATRVEQPAPAGAPPDPAPDLVAAARRAAFVRWLDHARAHRLRLVPGLEHPGDPRQPDNRHRH